jgi:uncharacterized OsmC-like protein
MTATVAANEAPRSRKRTPVPLNGVNTPALLATIDAVRNQPELARFQFRATSRWVSGTHSQSTMFGFFGAGGEQEHILPFKADGDHPDVLCGADNGPTPVEWVLHALASCLIAGIGNIAAARGIRLTKVEATLSGDIDLRGILGLSDEVRNGYERLEIAFEIEGDAPREKLEQVVMQAKARSAVYDIITNGIPVSIDVA